MPHTRGKPYHPMTQGKIERWHRSLKDTILLENYYLPGELQQRIQEFINHYNTRRHHESLNNLTPQDVWLGRGQARTTSSSRKGSAYYSYHGGDRKYSRTTARGKVAPIV